VCVRVCEINKTRVGEEVADGGFVRQSLKGSN